MLQKSVNYFVCFLCMFLFFVAVSSFAACDCGSNDALNPCTGTSITVDVVASTPNGGDKIDNSYTWSFNSGGKDAVCGQFANGDYWVAPGDGVDGVTITGISSTSHPALITADVDPVTESIGLMTGVKNYGNYNENENVILNLPQTYRSVTSLVAAIQRNESLEGNCGTSGIVGECIDSYNVLTILNGVPDSAGSETIRPNITGNTKEILTFSDFDLSRIPQKTFLAGTSIDGLKNITRRWSHTIEIMGLNTSANASNGYSEGGRAFRSHVLVDDYAAGTTAAWYNDLMVMFSDDNSLDEKKASLAAMLSYGLDLYHAIYDPPVGIIRYWGSGATQHPGKFMPVVFLAALAKDQKYANDVMTASSQLWDNNSSGPLELAQVLPGANGPVWGDIQLQLAAVNYHGAYWTNLIKSQCYDGAPGTCNPAIGGKNMLDPYGYVDGPPNKPATSYFGSSLGGQRAMVATMFLMPEVCRLVNYDSLVQYVDRTFSHGVQAGNDPCVTPDSREDFVNCDPYRNKGCLYYGKTWGPVDYSDRNSKCITTATPPYTKVGRFSLLDGNSVGAAYTSSQVESNWSEIRGNSGSCRAPFQGQVNPQ